MHLSQVLLVSVSLAAVTSAYPQGFSEGLYGRETATVGNDHLHRLEAYPEPPKNKKANLYTHQRDGTAGDALQYLSGKLEEAFKTSHADDERMAQFTMTMLRSNLKQCSHIVNLLGAKRVDAEEVEDMLKGMASSVKSKKKSKSEEEPEVSHLMKGVLKNNIERCQKMIKQSHDASKKATKKSKKTKSQGPKKGKASNPS